MVDRYHEASWMVEYEHWDADGSDSTRRTIGPFASQEEADTWALTAWVDGYDPRWQSRLMQGPWDGVMQNTGRIEAGAQPDG